MALTKEQELVKNTRGKNMLVSAAAGSGKTFVLVERIISEILDEKNGIDVDQILVVTFTNAAAAEMKDRIRQAIEKAILSNSSSARIRTQATLIHSAHIRTIDSFCNWIVKNYFYEIDMDPSFRIGQTGELKMLDDNVFNDLLSSKLENPDEDFKLLADAYISGRNISTLKDMVRELHKKAQSYAWPDEWYDNALKLYDIDTVEALADSEFAEEIVKLTDTFLEKPIAQLERFISLYNGDCKSDDATQLSHELALLKRIFEASSYVDKYEAINNTSFAARLGTKGTVLNNDDIKRARALRALYKEITKSLQESYYSVNLESMVRDISFVKRQAEALLKFAKEYSDALLLEKKQRNIFDFNDIEHMALEILRDKDSEAHEKSPVAIELSNHFKEVMVDEYQDSNELQEQILTAITNGRDYFTVGDVKQSIYAFRQASPKLFIDKLDSYPMTTEGDSIRIDLDKNFRSRFEVLEFCNKVFEPLMQMDVGGVTYDEKAALKLGDDSFKGNKEDYIAEMLIASEDKDAMSELNIDDADSLEALVIAKRIKELVAEQFEVSCKGDNGRAQRKMGLSDIVILMRGTKDHADKYISVLKDCGIPAYVAEETGFFDREEIETVLAMLQTIDNPFNDIPIVAALHSPMFGFSSERLAEIRATNPKISFYDCILEYQNEFHAKDVEAFLEVLNQFRDEAIDTPIHEMLQHILKETGFDVYTRALPNGKMASANLDKLIDEAIRFENTSFKGLSRFVSYIEGLKTYDEDLGLAKIVTENDEAVRIMTIHKSKGLEFPVVFVAGCGRGIKSEGGYYCYDDKLGLAMNYRNPTTRLSYKTPLYNIVKSRVQAEARGEYLRILYVALTRAVDKLIITSTVKPSSSKSVIQKLEEFDATLDTYTKLKASSSLELIVRALNITGYNYKRKLINCEDLFISEIQETISKEQAKIIIKDMISKDEMNSENAISNILSYEYDGIKDSAYKSKYSVSEIKHQQMEKAFAFNEDAAPAFIFNEDERYIPIFMRGASEEETKNANIPAGALYGTAMHRFLECYDFAREDIIDSFDEQLKYMNQIKCLSEDEFERISISKLKTFLKDDSANRMHIAALKNRLYKEKPFVFGSDAEDLFADSDASDELILVQGIIDVFWEEDDGIVLLDYKTDRVDEEDELVLRYEKQLQLYKSAIEKAYEQPVKEVLIYSFALERSISICTTN